MIEVDNLSVYYDDKCIIDQLSFALKQDELLTLVGPTGCGKTTILQALAGLIPIAQGSIKLGDLTATPEQLIPPEKRHIGMVFQDFALFPHLTVEQNIQFRLKDPAECERWLELLKLTPWRHAKPANLSGGQKQRVALARTLAHEPKCVLLDEPLSNLDAALKDDLRWEIRNTLKAANIPAIWVTHDQEEALSVGDRIGILRDGQLEQIDTPEVCYAKPVNRFVARFLGEASFLPGTLAEDKAHVQTLLGTAPTEAGEGLNQAVELLVRPDDVSLRVGQESNGQVMWGRYEGCSRLYAVETDDGAIIKIRCSHENIVAPGQRVLLNITTTHPLAVFPAGSA